MSNKTIRDLTKTGHWQFTTEKPVREDLQLSCLMRIADATEVMSKNHVQLQKDAEFWQKEYYHEKNRSEMLARSIVAHKANYTRLKRKLEAMKQDVEHSKGT